MAAPRALGLKLPPRRAPRRLRSTADLRAIQRFMTHALVRPLGPDGDLQPRWLDGRPMAEVAEEFIKPNDRLSALDRLRIYGRTYWTRLVDCLEDDSPGLRALLGDEKFYRLAEAYLARHPSRSFTLRNLCSRLPEFIRREPRWTAPRTALAAEVASFEWAQTVAFDGEERSVLDPAVLARVPPSRLRLGLQPCLSLLRCEHPVDDFVIAAKRRDALRAEASHAVEKSARPARRARRLPPPRRGRIHVAVYRLQGRLFYKRLERPAFLILEALRRGQTVARAAVAGGPRVRPRQVQEWFALWAKLGWFCKPL